ncbi:hypothetical protein FSP39_024550 [Pinctada imbricata]|uniref:Uncharacterized protein n=1 Tax=Pinctada imbricata TaxID=66713 RepID=A0AA89BTP4_PINIB|nr:hypothetical protein FSP39_024550 [Pinctada imbricata]
MDSLQNYITDSEEEEEGESSTKENTDQRNGKALNRFHHDSHVTSCKFHPSNCNLFISGCQNMILSWDVRSPSNPCQKYRYKDRIGQDLLFNTDGDTFFSACDELSQDSADRNIMCWDFKSGVVLSNQIYQERYSCTRLKLHPTESHFLAQSHGNYIAIFSLNRPYKMTKAKRFEGHKLAGYSIGFDLTPDGASVVSGDAFGKVYVYNYNTGRNHKTLRTDIDVCMDVSCHPLLPSTFVCCGWDGSIEVWH